MHHRRMLLKSPVFLAVCGVLITSLWSPAASGVVAGGESRTLDSVRLAAKVNDALAAVKSAPLDEAWNAVDSLKGLGAPSVPLLIEALENAAPQQKLIIGRVLVALDEVKKAAEVYAFLLVDRSTPPDVRVAACRVVGLTRQLSEEEGLVDLLRRNLYSALPAVRIAAADALLNFGRMRDPLPEGMLPKDTLAHFGRMSEARDTLERLSSRNDEYGEEAALTLAESGYVSGVASRLWEIRNKPTPNGRRAFRILNPVFPGESVLKETYEKIQGYYVDAKDFVDTEDPKEDKKKEEKEKNKRQELITATARGMVSALDPFSSYLDKDDVQDIQESLEGKYGGIGAYVDMHNGIFTIVSPIYDGPAYKVGLRSMDKVLKVGGKDTREMRFFEVVKNLKGDPGTPVEVEIFRAGWHKPRDYTIVRGQITIKSVRYRMLPLKIGYIKLTRFGENTTSDCMDAIDDLKKQDARAYILDLRDNGGGLLDEAVGIADLFLDRGELIVYSEGRKEVSKRKNYRGWRKSRIGDLPLIVLVNTGSASASEIVAGAIQDLERGALIGEKTYGKGSVQTLFNLVSTGSEAKVRLTIAKYYLPTGRTIHKEGVEPDIKISPHGIAPWKLDALVKLEDKVEEYVSNLVKEHPEIVQTLSSYDYRDISRYHGLEEFVKSIDDQRIEADDVRRYVRGVLRRRAADIRGKAFVADIEEDVVLRRGIFEVIRILNEKELPPEYAGLAEEFPEEEKDKLAGWVTLEDTPEMDEPSKAEKPDSLKEEVPAR